MAQVLPSFYDSFTRGRKDAIDFQNLLTAQKQAALMNPLDVLYRQGNVDAQGQQIRGATQANDFRAATMPGATESTNAGYAADTVDSINRRLLGLDVRHFVDSVGPDPVNRANANTLGTPGQQAAFLNPPSTVDQQAAYSHAQLQAGGFYGPANPTDVPNPYGQTAPPAPPAPPAPTIGQPASAPANQQQGVGAGMGLNQMPSVYNPQAPANQAMPPAGLFGDTQQQPPAYDSQSPQNYLDMLNTLRVNDPQPLPKLGVPMTQGDNGIFGRFTAYDNGPGSTALDQPWITEPTPYKYQQPTFDYTASPESPVSQNPNQQPYSGLDIPQAATQNFGPDVLTFLAKREQEQNLPPGFYLAIAQQENKFKLEGTSPKGAQGPFQIMPKNTLHYSEKLKRTMNPDDPMDAAIIATELVQERVKKYGSKDLTSILSSYNAGYPNKGRPDPWNNEETALYVPGVLTYLRNFSGSGGGK